MTYLTFPAARAAACAFVPGAGTGMAQGALRSAAVGELVATTPAVAPPSVCSAARR